MGQNTNKQFKVLLHEGKDMIYILCGVVGAFIWHLVKIISRLLTELYCSKPWYMEYRSSTYLPAEAKAFYKQFKDYEDFHKYMLDLHGDTWLYYLANGAKISILDTWEAHLRGLKK